MLQVDLKEPDEIIRQFIKDQCSPYGKVMSVQIHRPTTFAMVTMANHMQTLELAGMFGGSASGTSVLIHLEQKP